MPPIIILLRLRQTNFYFAWNYFASNLIYYCCFNCVSCRCFFTLKGSWRWSTAKVFPQMLHIYAKRIFLSPFTLKIREPFHRFLHFKIYASSICKIIGVVDGPNPFPGLPVSYLRFSIVILPNRSFSEAYLKAHLEGIHLILHVCTCCFQTWTGVGGKERYENRIDQ